MTKLDLGREQRRARIECRAVDADGLAHFEGYATVWDHAYDVYGGPEEYGWSEHVSKGAATKTLRERANIALLHQHDDGRVLATTRSSALTIVEDDIGLLVQAELDTAVTWVNDTVLQMLNGTIDEMSIGFQVIRQEWDGTYTDRNITELRLFEVSLVWAGANDATVATITDRALAAVREARAATAPKFSGQVRAALLAEAERARRPF